MTKILITNSNQFLEINEVSFEKTAIIFKHSSRCGISSMVLSRFEKMLKPFENIVAFYFLDLIKFRELSNEIAQLYNVKHQSPQILVIKNGMLKTHHSHYDIVSEFTLQHYV
jgi:bacillithiol system protein YtxJ